ncbi:hypothetical protein GCM10008985_13900 [Halococcus dombrowskii]|uniref:Right handed beta helix domain-containing protein n=2 Tax=Halococcus dombrowskii TaxID=179637 RepID=A0AAV3SG13_HALDO
MCMVNNGYTQGEGDLNRRTVLRGIAAMGVAAGGFTVSSGAVAGETEDDCDIYVNDDGGGDEGEDGEDEEDRENADYRSIQAAENAAGPGETICVAPGTYRESVGIDTPNLTITSTEDREEVDVIGQEGASSATISIDADGVTFDGISVHNPDRLIGVKVERGVSGATVSNTLVSDVGPTGRLGVTGILAGGNNEDLVFDGNTVESLQQAGEGPFNPSTNGIFIDNNGSESTNVVITNNEIKDLTSEYASIGILTQDATDVRIEGNSVRDVSADDPDGIDFATGINVDGGSNVTVRRNDVRDVTSDDGLGAAFVADGSISDLTVTANNLVSRIGFGNNTASTLDATCNYWGSSSGPYDASDADSQQDNPDGEGSDIAENPGAVDFTPWSTAPIDGDDEDDEIQDGSCSGGIDQDEGEEDEGEEEEDEGEDREGDGGERDEDGDEDDNEESDEEEEDED